MSLPRLPLDPQIDEGTGFIFSLKMRLREISRFFNGAADQVDANTTSLAGKVNRAGDTMTGGLNLVSPSTSATEANSDNSTKIATTAWVRNAMATIAAAAGFAFNPASTGYIKFPSWLGGWVVQWGITLSSSGGDVSVAYPISFPTGPLAAVAMVPSSAVGWIATLNTLGLSNMALGVYSGAGARQAANAYWLVWGS